MSNQNGYLTMAQVFIMANKNRIPDPNTPWKKNAINAIMSGNEEAGIQLSNNLCQTMGISKNDAINGGLNILESSINSQK